MINDVKDISIKDYLESIGIPVRQEGEKYFASSPFSRDTNWSFCIYPTNTFYDWSSGRGGNILNLISYLYNIRYREAANYLKQECKGIDYVKNYEKPAKEVKKKAFDYKKYINTNPEECKKIKEYAASRGIESGYEAGVFYTRAEDDKGLAGNVRELIRNPAMMFLHRDKNLNICGAKFRKISNVNPRFSARGSLGLFIEITSTSKEKNSLPYKPVLYVVEGEINAISLKNVLEKLNYSAIVLSVGGVGRKLTGQDLPNEYKNLPIKIIIDYDGDEELYQERLKLYSGLGPNAQPIRLILPKGEDINSLYNLKKTYLIEHLL